MRGSSVMILVGIVSLSLVVKEPLCGQIGLQEVTSLRFQGNRTFPDKALANAINTRETECRSFLFKIIPFCLAGADFSLEPYYLNEREFRRDHARVRLFYYQRGFREAVVDTLVVRPSEDEVRITFQIQEGEPIRVMRAVFPGVEDFPDSSVLENLPTRSGEPLSLVALDASRDTLETRFRNLGYAHVDVLRGYLIPRESPYEAEVTFEIYPGPLTRLGPLTVEVSVASGGEPTVDESVVRRMLPFREGDVYREDLQFAGQRNLYNLDLFRFVSFQPDTLPAVDSILPLTIQVQEGNVHRVRTGGGLSTAECFNFEASWLSRNFVGGARRMQVTGRVANVFAHNLANTPLCRGVGSGEYGDLTGLISADFTQPWFFSPRNSISAGLFAERQSVNPTFVRTAVGLNMSLTRTVAVSTFLGVSFRPHLTSLSAGEVFFCSAYLICSPDEISALEERNRLSPLGISFSQDRRNQPLSPTQGHLAAVDLEYAAGWTGSEFPFTRIVSEGTWYAQSGSRWVFGARLRGGWVSPDGSLGLGEDRQTTDIVHPEKRLFAGGPNSVRGYAQNRLGPRVLYLDDVEKLFTAGICTPSEVADLTCDPGPLGDEDFLTRPTGGTRLLEGNLEVRVPLGGQVWEGATFLDFGQVWADEDPVSLSDLRFSPGFGIRYFSPIGPIRVDVGYRIGGGEALPVVTEQVELRPCDDKDYCVLEDLVVLETPKLWRDGLGPWNLRRFQLHFSIGQAF